MDTSKQGNRKCAEGLCPRLRLNADLANEHVWQSARLKFPKRKQDPLKFAGESTAGQSAVMRSDLSAAP